MNEAELSPVECVRSAMSRTTSEEEVRRLVEAAWQYISGRVESGGELLAAARSIGITVHHDGLPDGGIYLVDELNGIVAHVTSMGP